MRIFRYAAAWCLVCVYFNAISRAADLAPLPQNLADTLDLYLSSDSEYKAGDLITSSQLQDFQAYLRRTKGPSVATHPRWPKLMLDDRDTLSQLFYNGHAALLRSVAAKSGGYGPMHQLSMKPLGRKLMKNATRSGAEQQILSAVADLARQKEATADKRPESAKGKQRPQRLFTANEFLVAVEALHRKKLQNQAENEALSAGKK